MREFILILAYLVSAGHGQQYGDGQLPVEVFAESVFSKSPLEPLAALLLTPQSTHAFNPSPALAAKWPQDVSRGFMRCASRAHRVMLPEHCMPIMSTSDDETEKVGKRARLVTLSTNAGAAVCAGFEVAEDVESIGHGHGMLLLVLSKLCREANVLREAFEDQGEEVKEWVGESKKKVSSKIRKPLRFLLRMLSSQVFTTVLAIGALGAAIMEVLEDSVIGGHHGTLLLAINELLELLEASRIAKGGFLRLITKQTLRLTLLLGATTCALVETLGVFTTSAKLGAHHGVLIFAISRLLRCIGLVRKEAGGKKED